MVELFANSGDPDQMPHSVASDLGLLCLPVTLLEVFRLQLVKVQSRIEAYNFLFDFFRKNKTWQFMWIVC